MTATGISAVPPTSMLRAIDVLEAFLAAGGGPLGLSEVSRRSGASKLSTHRLLVALAARGLLAFDPQTRKYTLGLRLVEFAYAAQQAVPLVALARPVLDRLRDLSGETVVLMVRDGDYRVNAAISPTLQPVGWITDAIGKRNPLYQGATGIVLLSELSDAEVRARIHQGGFDIYGAPHPEAEILDAVREVRALGSAVLVHGGGEMGTIAFPVRSSSRQILAVIGISGPGYRWDRARIEPLRPELKRIVRDLEGALGYREHLPIVGRAAAPGP
jgi:DNA-binding IclR family transcriptional regulator